MKPKKAKPKVVDLDNLDWNNSEAIFDKRKKQISPAAMRVAEWCLRYRGVAPIIDIDPRFGRPAGDDIMCILKEANSDFLREMADALDRLKSQNPEIEDGILSRNTKLTPKMYVAMCWKHWENQNDKIDRRLALIRERFGKGISRRRYYEIVKVLGLKSE